MKPNAKKLFVNIGTFVVLLESWWIVGDLVSQVAIRMDGKFFDSNLSIVGGYDFNSWFAVIAALLFGLGCAMSFLVITSFVKSRYQALVPSILLYVIPVVLVFAIHVRIDVDPRQLAVYLFDMSSYLLNYGIVTGIFMGH